MDLIVTKADLERRATPAEIYRFSQNGNDDLVTGPRGAIVQAISKARSAALQIFTAASWDAMTADTLPGEALSHIVSDAIDILSTGNSGRSADIQTKADEAKLWRTWLAAGSVHCFDDVLVRISYATGGANLRSGAPEVNRFDSDNPCNPTKRNLWPT